jgi:hypothetical protein
MSENRTITVKASLPLRNASRAVEDSEFAAVTYEVLGHIANGGFSIVNSVKIVGWGEPSPHATRTVTCKPGTIMALKRSRQEVKYKVHRLFPISNKRAHMLHLKAS